MDGPLAPMLFPQINWVTMHPAAACAPPPTFVLLDPMRCSESRLINATAGPAPVGRFFVVGG